MARWLAPVARTGSFFLVEASVRIRVYYFLITNEFSREYSLYELRLLPRVRAAVHTQFR